MNVSVIEYRHSHVSIAEQQKNKDYSKRRNRNGGDDLDRDQ